MADTSFKPIPIPRLGAFPTVPLLAKPRKQLICWRDRGKVPTLHAQSECVGLA